MAIAIYGAGSLGIVMGAYLSKGGIKADLVNRNAAQVAALNEKGAKVVGKAQLTAPVHAVLPAEMIGTYDLIFLTTKQQQNEETATFLKPFLGEKGVVVTVQNGLPEMKLMAILGEDRVFGCTVEWGATLLAPGVSELTSEPDSLSFGLGCYGKADPQKLNEIKAVLEKMCAVNIEENFIGTRYAKLLINASFSGMSAVLGCTFGEAAGDKRSRKYVQRIIKECIDVCAASDVTMPPVQGKDIVKLLNYNGPLRKAISSLIIPIAIKKHAKLKASMLQDIENGKSTEVDDINGALVAQGKGVKVKTPTNEAVVSIIHRIEMGELKPSFDNLKYFEA